jgi:hypothetical protein
MAADGCRAQETTGHATTAPPNSVMNSRRLIPGMGSLPGAASIIAASGRPKRRSFAAS